MLLRILDDADLAEMVLNRLDFRSLANLSRVSKTVRQSHDFQALLEGKTTRFVHGRTYVSTPTGWYNWIEKYTAKRKNPRGKMLFRRKVRMRNGVEWVRLGPNDKYPTISAADLHTPEMDARIEANNTYWSENW